MASLDLYLLDENRTPVSVVVHNGITWEENLWGGDRLEIEVDRGLYDGDDDLMPGRFLYLPRAANCYRIEEVLIEDEGGHDHVEVIATDPAAHFGERLVIPTAPDSHDEVTAVPAETAIKHYVNRHAGPSATVSRQFDGLTVAADLAQGVDVTVAARYQTLQATVDEIGEFASMGYSCTYDTDAEEWTLDVVPGVDRTATVILDPDFDTAEGLRWLRSFLGGKNLAVVGGQGEAAARTIETVFTGTEPSSFDRRELFVDARDIDNAAGADALEVRGLAKLAETRNADPLQVEVNPRGLQVYGEDYNLGDVVTARHLHWGLDTATRIVKATHSIAASSASREGPTIRTKVEIGSAFPDLRDRIVNDQELIGGSGRE